MLQLDGSTGEGGGQVLRTSLSLSAALGTPFRLTNVRSGRRRPGLMRQHLTAVKAAAEVCGARVHGAELGSTEVEFEPDEPRAGDYRFAVGSAGSAMLVLQTVLGPLLRAGAESRVVVEGGTHNPWAPPFESLQRSFAPLLDRLGVELELELDRAGFYPAGGGRVIAHIRPSPPRREMPGASSSRPFELLERGPERSRSAEALLAHLPASIGERELASLQKRLAWDRYESSVQHVESAGPGNIVHVTLAFEEVTEVFTGFGEKGTRAESIGKRVGAAVQRYLARDAPVGEHLADQLMVPLVLLGGGSYRATLASRHARTNAEIVSRFVSGAVKLDEDDPKGVLVQVAPSGGEQARSDPSA